MYKKQTKQGYEIVAIIPDGSREHIIAKRDMSWEMTISSVSVTIGPTGLGVKECIRSAPQTRRFKR